MHASFRKRKRDRLMASFGTVCLYTCCLPHVLYEEYHLRKLRRAMNWSPEEYVRPPTPEKRKRRLTSPLPSVMLPRTKQHTVDQKASTLSHLPAEIRLLIYEEYIGREQIWVHHRDNRLRAWRSCADRYPKAGEHLVDVIPLLQTCRKIYSEAIELVYTIPVFTFLTPTCFLSFASSILPHRLVSIRSITLDYSSPIITDGFANSIPRILFYPRAKSHAPVLNLLPRFKYTPNLTFWSAVSALLVQMTGLRYLNLIFDDRMGASLTSWKADAELTNLIALTRRGVKMDVCTLERVDRWGMVRKMWKWRPEKESVVWVRTSGEIIFQQTGHPGEIEKNGWNRWPFYR